MDANSTLAVIQLFVHPPVITLTLVAYGIKRDVRQSVSPVDCRVHHPEYDVIGTTSFVVGADSRRSAQNVQKFRENLVCLLQTVVGKCVVDVSLPEKRSSHTLERVGGRRLHLLK